MTNYERRKKMSLDEMARYIVKRDEETLEAVCKELDECPYGDDVNTECCVGCVKQWLLRECDENEKI